MNIFINSKKKKTSSFITSHFKIKAYQFNQNNFEKFSKIKLELILIKNYKIDRTQNSLK
jgi:hypothetical protein